MSLTIYIGCMRSFIRGKNYHVIGKGIECDFERRQLRTGRLVLTLRHARAGYGVPFIELKNQNKDLSDLSFYN
jgi:hypothetical protein